MNNRTNIVEIIPDDMPEWMIEAMSDGQLFRTVIDKLNEMEKVLEFYSDEAEAICKNFNVDNEAVLASVALLMLDAGNRAKQIKR